MISISSIIERGADAFKLAIVCFSVFVAQFASAGPISSLVFDLDGTLIHRNQDYSFEDGQLRPLREELSGVFTDKSGNQKSFVYFLDPHARELLKKALAHKAEGHLENGISVLTQMPQAKLNAILRAIVIDGTPMIDLVQAAFGSEAIMAYSELMGGSDGTERGKKDLGIFTSRKNIALWSSLKTGDVSRFNELSRGKVSGPMTAALVDDKPSEVNKLQLSNVVKISRLVRRNDSFWKRLQNYSERSMETPQSSFESQTFLSLVEAERNQLEVLGWLLDDSKRTSTPNAFDEWTSLLTSPRTLGLDFAHFNFLIPDLVKKDDLNQDILVLGRDADLFNTALETVKDRLGIKSKLFYLEISRLVAQNEAKRLPQILSKAGIDIEAIRRGERKLLIVDSNYNGSIPKAILLSLVPLNDPDWRVKVKRIRTWLFNPARYTSSPPESFATYNDYLINGAFIDRAEQQERVGHDYMRMVTAYQDINRPKKNIRAVNADEAGRINSRASHPTEYRYADILHRTAENYYRKPGIATLLQNRLSFLRGSVGNYPRMWALSEPAPLPDPPRISESDLNEVKASAKSHHRFLLKAANQFKNVGSNPPKFVPNHRLPRQEIKVEWHMYAPTFAQGEALDLSQSFLRLPEIKPIYDLSAWPKLDESSFEATRIKSVYAMSRTAKGVQGNAGKVMTKDGSAMAEATLAANREVGVSLLEARTKDFRSGAELAEFIIDKINIPYVQEVREIHSRADIWRTWAFQNEEQKATGDFFARHSPLRIERDWAWFSEWLQKNLDQDYDPVDLSARAHYYLSNWIHPFADGVGKTTRDLIDFIFIRKGLAPVDWSRVEFATYWEASGSIDGIRSILLNQLEQHRLNNVRSLPVRHKTQLRACHNLF